MLQKLLAIIIIIINLFIAEQQKLLIIAWLNYCVSIVLLIKQTHKYHKKNKLIIKKHINQFILTSLYLIWVINICWECSIKKKKCCDRINMIIGSVSHDYLIYFVPIILNTYWKTYILLKNTAINQQQQQNLIEQLLKLQSQAQLVILFYFPLNHFTKSINWIYLHTNKLKITHILQAIAKLLLISCYIGIKYEWSIPMRQSCWRMHLFIDKISYWVYLRKKYHQLCGFIMDLKSYTAQIYRKSLRDQKQIQNKLPNNYVDFQYVEALGQYFDFI